MSDSDSDATPARRRPRADAPLPTKPQQAPATPAMAALFDAMLGYSQAARASERLQGHVRDVIVEVIGQDLDQLQTLIEAESAAYHRLDALLETAEAEFPPGAKSVEAHGVRIGYRQGADTIEVPDEAETIKQIRKVLDAESQELLIRTRETVALEALSQVPAATLRRLAVDPVPGTNVRFIRRVQPEIGKLAEAVLKGLVKRLAPTEATR